MLAREEYSDHHTVLQMVKEPDWLVMVKAVSALKVKYSYNRN